MTLAFVLALLIGLSLGLLGGGGSILTVPILIYALGVEEKAAIATSLVVVGATSLVAALQHARKGNVVLGTALWFGGGGMVGAYLGGRAAVLIPASVLLLLFAGIMLATAIAMWRGRRDVGSGEGLKKGARTKALAEGLVVGAVTGLVGAGGGFLVVPALALLGGLPMHQAVGTSLVVIALKSFAGYAGYAAHVDIDWRLAGVVGGAAILGSFVGTALAGRVPPEKLRKGFAVFVVVMAVYLIARQVM